LGLELTIEEVRKAIFSAKKLKLKPRVCRPHSSVLTAQDVHIKGHSTIKITMPDDVLDKDIWSALQRYMRELPTVIVKVCSYYHHPTDFRESIPYPER